MATTLIRVSEETNRLIQDKRGSIPTSKYIDSLVSDKGLPEPWGTLESINAKLDLILNGDLSKNGS